MTSRTAHADRPVLAIRESDATAPNCCPDRSKTPPEDARAQIELITGSADTPIRVRAIGGTGRGFATERLGSLRELHPWMIERSLRGANLYMVAQRTGPISHGLCANDDDVTGVRCLYADGDESALPTEWHEPPTFTLLHPETQRWWAFWCLEGHFELTDLPNMIRRIAMQYGSDASISNPSRVVRLAGYDRWKDGANYGPYDLHQLSGRKTECWQHEGLPAIEAHWDKRRDRSKEDTPAHLVIVDDPQNAQFFADWCAGKSRRTRATPDGAVAEPCVEGNFGNNKLAATGAMARDYGLSQDLAVAIAAEHFNPRCEPPWDDEEFERHFRSGYRSASGQLGSRAPILDVQSMFKPQPKLINRYADLVRHFEDVLSATGTRERRAVRYRDAQHASPIAWTIDGWLSANGAWLMYGESESYKTYIVITMLLCVATGTPWAARSGFEGYAVGAPRQVILFAGESFSGVVQRIRAAIAAGVFDQALVDENLILVPDVYALNRADGLAGMADEIEALGARPALIAVDTLNLALDGNEDSSEEIKKALRGLRALATMFDATGLAIDHVGHADKSRPRGSSAKKANSDGMILCERGDNSTVKLTQQKNRDADKSLYRASFIGTLIELGVDPITGRAISNLCFAATEEHAPHIGKARSKAIQDKFVMDTIAQAVIKRLEANPTRDWSNSALADAVATDATITVGSSMLRQRYLKLLREDSSNPASRHYNAETNRWRYAKSTDNRCHSIVDGHLNVTTPDNET